MTSLGFGQSSSIARFEFTEKHMAVDCRIVLYTVDETTANAAKKAAFARIAEINKIFSDYDPESEVSRLCKTAKVDEPLAVSHDLFEVLQRSKSLSVDSDGAFDVTLGPLIKLWRASRKSRSLPDEVLLARVQAFCGHQRLELIPASKSVCFRQREMSLDFGGIAKGYAAEEALKVLKTHGVTRAFVAIAGDIALGDPPPERLGWKVGVQSLTSSKPTDSAEPAKSQFLTLSNRAVSTSGDDYQFVEINGVRYSHIVDPQTGLGLTHRLSVTVVANDGATADGLATAISVLGPKRGMSLIQKINDRGRTANPAAPPTPIEALIISEENNQLVRLETSGFQKLVFQQDPQK